MITITKLLLFELLIVNIGAYLRNFVLSESKKRGIIKIIAMTRCSRFKNNNVSNDDYNFADYENYVFSGKDPTIHFHLSGGAEVITIIYYILINNIIIIIR